MKKMKTLAALLGSVLVSILFCTVGMAASIPVPNDIQITPPDPALPDSIKDFSGKWKGTWYSRSYGYGFDAVLIVEKIETEKAIVVYCWEAFAKWQVQGGCTPRIPASITKDNGKYVLSWDCSATGAKYEFSLKGKKLEGYDTKWKNTITMKRMR